MTGIARAVEKFSPADLDLMTRTVASDCNKTEFDLFIRMCAARGLNPLLRHAYAQIFSKDDPKKRQMVVVVGIDGQRLIAERTGNYRPDDKVPKIKADKKKIDPAINPLGIVSAEVTVYKFSHNGWFPCPAIAYWDEYAPISEEWGDDPNNIGKRKKTGRQSLDMTKPMWTRMARAQLAKCAEMNALRKAFPESYAGIYAKEELDRSDTVDLTPSEYVEQAQRERREGVIGGPNLIEDWCDGQPFHGVPVGQFFDKAMAFIRANAPADIDDWAVRNRIALEQFWAADKAAALEIKLAIERRRPDVPA